MGTLEKAIDESQQVEYKARLERLDQAQKLVKKGELEAAFLLFRTNLTWSERALGASHDIAVIDQQSLAFILNQLGRYREASELNQKALWTLKYAEGESSPSQRQLNIRQNLASDYIGLGNRRLAVSIYRKNFEARRQHPQLGEDHVDTTKTGELLALSLYKIEDFVGACDLQRKVLAAMIRTKAQDIEILRSRQTFSLYLFRLGRFGAAKILLEKNIEALKSRVTDAALLASGERCLSRCSTKMEEQGTETTYAGQKNILQSPTSDTDADIPEDPKSQFLDIGNTMIPIRGVRAIASSQNELPGTGKRVVTNTPVSLRLQNANLQPPPDTPKVSTQNRGGQAGKCPASKEYAFNTKDGPSIVNIVPAGQKNLENPKFASAIPTINEPAADPTPRTKAKTPQPVLGQQDKAWSKPRPRSVSPGSGWSARQYQPPLFDASEGKYDWDSKKAVKSWLYSLNTETQKLLQPLRRDRGKRVKIAILDTGLDLTHRHFQPELAKKRIKKIEDFLDPGGSGQDACGHGSHCTGLLRLVAPEADIYIARITKDKEGKLDPDIVAKAINRASRDGADDEGKKNWNADIISMSFGFYGWVPVVKKAIDEALSKPVLVFAAASNNGTRRKVTFPAYLPGVICINSATADGVPSGFNPPLDAARNFSIIGENVCSAWITHSVKDQKADEKRMSGTSVATPIAAGVAALLLEFAMQSDPSDPVTDALLKAQLDWLKQYDGMIEILSKMSEVSGGYRNIIPWNVLNNDYGRSAVANIIKIELFKKFRS